MKTKIVTFDDGETTARVEVSEATVLQGAKRSRLRFEGDGEREQDRRIVRLFLYPDLIAAARTVEINGVLAEPDFESFLRLPEQLVTQWETATFTLNPHWLPAEPSEKKE